jgi:hypothetical protein
MKKHLPPADPKRKVVKRKKPAKITGQYKRRDMRAEH